LSWESSIILEKNEKIITSWRGNRETAVKVSSGQQYGYGVQTAKERKSGFLVLTNQRLLFLEEHGVFGKSYHQTVTIPLTKLGGISMGGLIMPFISVSDDFQSHVFHISNVGKNEFEPFKQLIIDECRKRKEEIELEKKKERVQLVVDFSMLKDYMEKGGLVLQKIKCPECGAPFTLPTTGNQTKCEHCGNTIYVQDVFEKIKSLI
jgi:DNA-directed RNA polymerase subunit RPC12/RpoP